MSFFFISNFINFIDEWINCFEKKLQFLEESIQIKIESLKEKMDSYATKLIDKINLFEKRILISQRVRIPKNSFLMQDFRKMQKEMIFSIINNKSINERNQKKNFIIHDRLEELLQHIFETLRSD